ncbi:MAG: hypothetical protein K8F60_01590 [Melioribacteraceae bacterium]|jgi:hypothetical protein|nr:hypothetical protein [Ignavibacteriota bacterium]MBZ0181126.1 hypothetical protein [Melioribacteraceae bacterium]
MTARYTYQQRVDRLIDHFWKNGYLTISRKYGTYLPDPTPMGTYEVDAVGKYKKKLAIGITLQNEDLDNPKTISKLKYLAARNNRGSQSKLVIFVGVQKESFNKAKSLISSLDETTKKAIKLVSLSEN